MNTAGEAQGGDVLFDRIVKNARSILDESLGTSRNTPSTDSRIQNLPALQRELEIARKLEKYYRERAAQLSEQEEAQKKLRVNHRYLRLPKLPTEIIFLILSTFDLDFDSSNILDTKIPKAIDIMVKGLLPHLILRPYLVLPPYCKDFGKELAVEDIGKQKMEISVLTDPFVQRSISLKVDIKDWRVVRDDVDVLRSLLRVPHRWKELQLFFSVADDILPMLKTFGPCFRYIEDLTTYATENIIDTQSFPPASVESVVTGSTETIIASFCILPLLYNLGFLKHVKNLSVTKADISTFNVQRHGIFRTTLTNFPQLLSTLPHLEFLRICRTYCNENETLPKVRSKSLRTLEIFNEEKNASIVPFLRIFSECPIDTLDIDTFTEEVPMEVLTEIFPGMKKITYNGGSDFGILSSVQPDGMLLCPKLEELILMGLWRESEEVCNNLLRAVRLRSRTPGISRVKRLSLCSEVVPDPLFDEINRKLQLYVDSVEWL